MGCMCSCESDRPIKCTQTFDLQSNRYTHVNEHISSNNNQRNSTNNFNNLCFDDINEYQQRLLEPHLQGHNNPWFNFQTVNNAYSGEGLKRMKGYICPISKEDLERKRQFFWETRVEGNQEIWKFLRKLCEDPEFQQIYLHEYLFSSGIIPYCNCINVTYDVTGNLYEIPNYCINEPIKYIISETEKTKPIECELTIIIRHNSNQFSIVISNCASIDKLKEEIVKVFPNLKTSLQLSKDKLALFFGGKELKNNRELWFYNVTNHVVIILMIRN